MAEHDFAHGPNFSLRLVGCTDCGTESGAAYTCCRALRCHPCHDVHMAKPEEDS